jgi:hypothetical protein
LIGTSSVRLAGLTATDQYFAAITDTDTHLADTGSSGILGLGFPFASDVLAKYFMSHFPDLVSHSNGSSTLPTRQSTFEALLDLLPTGAPLIPRAIHHGDLPEPLVAITLQRDTIDPGGNAGILSLGGLPSTVDENALTWSNVRLYNREQVGYPPAFGDALFPLYVPCIEPLCEAAG